MAMPEPTILERIREGRLAKHLNQTELAKKLGIRQSQISDLERGTVDPRLSPVQALEVRLGEIVVGTLARLENDATIFAFDPEYAADANRPTLSLAFKGPDGNLVENLRPVRTRLSPFFSNLLPEGHLRQYLAT